MLRATTSLRESAKSTTAFVKDFAALLRWLLPPACPRFSRFNRDVIAITKSRDIGHRPRIQSDLPSQCTGSECEPYRQILSARARHNNGGTPDVSRATLFNAFRVARGPCGVPADAGASDVCRAGDCFNVWYAPLLSVLPSASPSEEHGCQRRSAAVGAQRTAPADPRGTESGSGEWTVQPNCAFSPNVHLNTARDSWRFPHLIPPHSDPVSMA